MALHNLGKTIKLVGGLVFGKYRQLGMTVYNGTGSAIAADKVVALSGFDTTNGVPKVVLADADVVSHLGLFVTKDAIANGAMGHVYKGGLSAANLNTNGASAAGDPVYLDTTAGGFTVTAPTAGNARQFQVGSVVVKSATVGQIAWDISFHGPDKYATGDFNGIGFGAGDGGVVTQATNKSTGVTLSKKSGQITLNGAALGSDTTVSFVLTNTFIEATDLLILNHISGGTAGSYSLNAQCAAGSATINVRNYTAGSLSEAIVIGFVLVKGASA
jgi:hypothetical protein